MLRIQTLLVGAALLGAATAQTLVIPSAAAAADGNSSTSYPFDVTTGRFLYVYDSTHFTNNGVTFPILINQIAWRANGSTTTWTGAAINLQVDLSTSPADYTAISTTWNNNHGADRATVFNGPATIAAGSATAGSPGPFHVVVTFASPFLYDPSLGDLVIDTTHTGNTTANTPACDAVTTVGVANAKRIYSLTNPPAATATLWSGDLANVLEFTYTPAAGLYAGFTANVTGGASPLAVNFTDTTYTSAPGGITSWAWDFQNDGIVDSALQNPSFNYTSCGTYTVALTVTDGVNPPSTLIRTNYITTDLISANFSEQVVGPLTVQFTDTSNMPATSWAWDLDGDAVVDSNLPNPAWIYPNTNPVNVTLTVTRLCSPPSTITRSIVPTQVLSTNLTANNGGSSLWTVYFDVNVLNPLGAELSAFDIITSTTNTAFTLDVWLKQGTYVGAEGTASAWTHVGVASGTSNATASQPSFASLAAPIYIPAGNFAMAIRYTGVGPRYVGTGTGGPLTTIGNADLSLTLGSVMATTAGPFATGTFFTPRAWSGRIYYGTHNVTGSAGYGFFGQGCPGSLGTSSLTGTQPVLGGTLSVTVNNLPFAAALMVTGVSNTTSSFGPLPLDLTPLGMPGCQGRVSLDLTDFVVGAGNTATWNLPLPNNPTLSGLQFYNQAFVLDVAANPFGWVVSDAATMLLGF